jgi:hypothetical protein
MKRFFTSIIILFPLALFAQTIKLEENFDAGELPEGWIIIDNDGYTPHPSVADFSDAWVVVQDPDNDDNYVAGSTSYFQPVDRANRWLITPPIELDAFGNYISWFAKSHDPSYPDSYRIMLSDGGAEIEDFQDTIAIISNENPDGTARDFQIEGKDNQTVRIAFVNTTFNGFKLYIDSIKVRTEDPLTVKETQKPAITINAYPNPTSGKITLSKVVESFQLYDISGQMLQSLNNPTTQINLTELPKGLYFLHASISGEIVRIKLVKE